MNSLLLEVMTSVLDVAKVTAKGQITIPTDVRRAMGVREGYKVMFVLNDDGSVGLRSSTLTAIEEAQSAFAGAADEAGLEDEDDLVSLIRSIRAECSGNRSCE